MRLKGVCYDVGAVMGFNWRPVFDPKNAGYAITRAPWLTNGAQPKQQRLLEKKTNRYRVS